MSKILYYNIDDNLEYEKSLLDNWGVCDLELIEVKDKTNEKTIIDYAKEVDAIVVEYEKITDSVMKQLPNLKMISLQSIGYNNIDVFAATKNGICLTNVPGFCAEEVALHTVGLVLDLVRKISYYDRMVRAGYWNPLMGYKTYRIKDKVFGMVFFGDIPKKMVPILQALELKILVYAPTKTEEYLRTFGCKKADTLDQLLEQSDFVSLHTPLLPETKHLIGVNELKKMKKSAFLINTARGAVVDEKALVNAIKEGEIKGAGIDVIEDEVKEESELFQLENVVITPHAAFYSEDSFYEARRRALEHLVQFFIKKEFPDNLVNQEVKEKLIQDKT